MVILSNTLTETVAIKNLKLTMKLDMSMKTFKKLGVVCTVENVSRNAIQW